MIYMGVKAEDLLGTVLTQDELNFVSSLRIPFNDISGLWLKKQIIDQKVSVAIDGGSVSRVVHDPVVRQAGPQVISDCAGSDIHGIKSMADGKYYDSKSQYRKELKRRGLVEMGNDAPTVGKGPEANICEKEVKRDIAQAIQQLGG